MDELPDKTLINPGGREVDVPGELAEELLQLPGFREKGRKSDSASSDDTATTGAAASAAPKKRGNLAVKTDTVQGDTTKPATAAPKKRGGAK